MRSLENFPSTWTIRKIEVINNNNWLITKVRYHKKVRIDLDFDMVIKSRLAQVNIVKEDDCIYQDNP